MVVDRRGETAEADVALSEVFEDQHKLFQRPRQAVQLLDRQHVAPAHVVELRIPTQAGRGFRFDPGQGSDLMSATIPR